MPFTAIGQRSGLATHSTKVVGERDLAEDDRRLREWTGAAIVTLLAGHRVVAIDEAADGGLARYLTSLGATLTRVPLTNVAASLSDADFLIDRLGVPRLVDAG